MVCIIMLYGHLGSGLQEMAQFLQVNYEFCIVPLPELDFTVNDKPEDFVQMKSDIIDKSSLIIKECTKNWNNKQVLYPVYFKEQIQVLQKAIYAHLVYVQTSVMGRYYKLLSLKPSLSLEDFVRKDDYLYHESDMFNFYTRTSFSVSFNNELQLQESIKSQVRLKNILEGSYRTSSDVYFMQIAFISKMRSNCMKRAIGCVIVKDHRIVSIGYNGTPLGLPNCFEMGCQRCNDCVSEGQKLDTCVCLHAEESAILLVGSKETTGAVLYTTSFPCFWCAKVIIQCVC
jgi:dCMP deaminase